MRWLILPLVVIGSMVVVDKYLHTPAFATGVIAGLVAILFLSATKPS